MFAQAKALMHWHARHGHCANCGAPTRAAAAGWRRECDVCKAQHFPRTDPVVIMLAVDGDNCLLGRQARFPKLDVFLPRRLPRAGRDDRGRGAARDIRGGGDRMRRRRLSRLAALAIPGLADDRLHRAGRRRASSKSTASSSRTAAGSRAARSPPCWRGAIRQSSQRRIRWRSPIISCAPGWRQVSCATVAMTGLAPAAHAGPLLVPAKVRLIQPARP